ncbi:hypothetical protein NPIL_493021 [Nephila pilipes]|uniref:Uncharacterized protein n=1 Tax=Nephila pilipes TaxID=299642 RepID=A0A8X6NDG5_NEPPI|nr:hypothetical protein NPIL_493021 [Nephila pilipes]
MFFVPNKLRPSRGISRGNRKPGEIPNENKTKLTTVEKKCFQISITKFKETSTCIRECYSKHFKYIRNNDTTTSFQAIEIPKGEVRRKVVLKRPYFVMKNPESCSHAKLDTNQQQNETTTKNNSFKKNKCETNSFRNNQSQTNKEPQQMARPESVNSDLYFSRYSFDSLPHSSAQKNSNQPSTPSFRPDDNRRVIFLRPYSGMKNPENCSHAKLDTDLQNNETTTKNDCETNISSNNESQTNKEPQQMARPESDKSDLYFNEDSYEPQQMARPESDKSDLYFNEDSYGSLLEWMENNLPSSPSILPDDNRKVVIEDHEDHANDKNFCLEDPSLAVAYKKQVYEQIKTDEEEFVDKDLLMSILDLEKF